MLFRSQPLTRAPQTGTAAQILPYNFQNQEDEPDAACQRRSCHAHVAYIPRGGKVVGISKLARVTEGFARRPQLQERLTTQIAECINNKLNPLGVAVIIEAEHMCMTMRGIRKLGSRTITSAVRGIFQTRPKIGRAHV